MIRCVDWLSLLLAQDTIFHMIDKIARAVFWIVTGAVVIGVATWMAKKAGAKHP